MPNWWRMSVELHNGSLSIIILSSSQLVDGLLANATKKTLIPGEIGDFLFPVDLSFLSLIEN